jgi:hypothetical protein
VKLNLLNLVGIGLLQILSGSFFIQGGLVAIGATVMGIGAFIIVFGPIVLAVNKVWEDS